MSKIWHEAYEVVGDGVALAEAFYARRKEQGAALWEAVEAFGAEGYRPNHLGGVRSLLFREVPVNYRKVGVTDRLIECVPHKGSKAGKALAAEIAAVPPVAPENDLLDSLGWNGNRPCDGYRIFHGTVARLQLPSVRYLIKLPRELDDGFVAGDLIREIRMSDYVKAFEDHNLAAGLQNAKVAAE